MSATTDAVWIVKELMDEILGMIHFQDVEKKFDARMTHEMSEVEEEHDWVKLIDAEMKELIGGDRDCDVDYSCATGSEEVKHVDGDATPAYCDFCCGKCICDEVDAEMKELIGGDEESGDQKDIAIEKKEEKFPKYETMGFNWKEVEPIFKGQSEKMDNVKQ